MSKIPPRFRCRWLTFLISLQLCFQPLLQGQESATQEKKKAETPPAENQTVPPKSSDSDVPQKEPDEVIEVKTPFGPMKVLKKAGAGTCPWAASPRECAANFRHSSCAIGNPDFSFGRRNRSRRTGQSSRSSSDPHEHFQTSCPCRGPGNSV